MSLAQYVRLVARRLFVVGIAFLCIGLYLGFTGGFEPWLKLMTLLGGGVGVASGVICFVIPYEPE